jgi:hypothetical protein
MREKILVILLMITTVFCQATPNAVAQEAAQRAQQLLAQARAAIGGGRLAALQSLSVAGDYRRTMGDREMTGEIQLDLLLPDKMMRTETMSPMPSMEITRIEAMSGDKVWFDQQSSGGGGGMVMIRRPGSDTPQGQAMQQQAVRSEMARLALGLLLNTPSSFPVEYNYVGTAEAPDGKAEALDVKGPHNFAARLFFDQKTHRLVMMTYQGRQPRMITRTAMGPERRTPEEMEKLARETEAEAARQPLVEFQIRYDDYRDVQGLSLPHRLSRAVDGVVNEEWEVTRYKLNPPLKPTQFEKK